MFYTTRINQKDTDRLGPSGRTNNTQFSDKQFE